MILVPHLHGDDDGVGVLTVSKAIPADRDDGNAHNPRDDDAALPPPVQPVVVIAVQVAADPPVENGEEDIDGEDDDDQDHGPVVVGHAVVVQLPRVVEGDRDIKSCRFVIVLCC